MTVTDPRPESFDPAGKEPRAATRGVLPPGHRLGSFQLVRLLGVGGMGEVYLAERVDGRVDQRVAIKVLSHRVEAPQGRRRFQAEQQILARLSHPHIAKLFDVGSTPDDRAYFVMEWVDGEPLDAYAEREGLDLQQRLLLFRKICSAVAYAHRNLVIHRDIKPSNILVDREGEPKLLDFGIAKWVGHGAVPGVDETQTLDGQSPMTPAFASPEQLAGESLTTSSDIYSLGILLYQLLTGQVPFSRRSWEKLDRDPVKPSEALAQAPNDEAPPIDPRQLRGDGDNILLKAVRLEIDHRYKDVAALDEDIGAFLKGDPVSAGRGTPLYLVRRLISRHRAAAALSVLMVVLFFVAFGLLAWQNRVITEERNRSNAEARRTALTRDFAVDLLRAVDASQRNASEVTLEDLLGRGLERLKAGEVSDPIAHADLLRVIGDGYASLNALIAASQAYGLALESLDEALLETTDDMQISEIQALRRGLLLLKIPSELRRGATDDASRSMGELMELLATLEVSPEEDLVAWMRLTELHAITGKDKPFLEHHNAILSRPLGELELDKMAVVTSLHHRLDIMLQRGRVDRAEEVLELTRKLVSIWGLEHTLFIASLKAYEGLIASSRHDSARAVAALTESCGLYTLRAHPHDPGMALCHYWLARAEMTAGAPIEEILQTLDIGIEAAEKLLDYGADGRASFVYAYGVLHYALVHWADSGETGPAHAYARQALDVIGQQPQELLEAGFMRMLPILALGVLGEREVARGLMDDYLSVGLRQADVMVWAEQLGLLEQPLPPPVELPVQLPEGFRDQIHGAMAAEPGSRPTSQ